MKKFFEEPSIKVIGIVTEEVANEDFPDVSYGTGILPEGWE